MLEIQPAKTLNLGNPQIYSILQWGIVTSFCSHHFEVLPGSITMPHSTWHQVHNQALVQPNDIWVIGHRGKHMISPNEVMVDLKCFPLSNSQDMGHPSHGHLECHQQHLKTNQSLRWHLPLLLHQDNFPRNLGDHLLAAPGNDFSRLRNHNRQMLQGLPIWPHYQKFPTVSTMQIITVTIHWTWAGPKGKAPIRLKWTKFSVKQFAKRMMQPNSSTFNKRKKVWVAGFLEKKHWAMIRGQYHMKQQRDRPVHWLMVVANVLETFRTWHTLETFDNVEWIRRHSVKVFSQNCAIEVREVRKKGRWGNLRPVTELGQRVGKRAAGNVPEMRNTTFMVLIRRVPNGNNDKPFSEQLTTSCTAVRHWEELINFIVYNCGPNQPYCLTATYKCNLTQEEVDEEYIRLYAPGQLMNDPLYGQISYPRSLSDAFKLKLRPNVKLLLIEMKTAVEKDIAEHVIGPAKVIPAHLVSVSDAPLLISILTLWRYLIKMKVWCMRRQMENRMTVVLM